MAANLGPFVSPPPPGDVFGCFMASAPSLGPAGARMSYDTPPCREQSVVNQGAVNWTAFTIEIPVGASYRPEVPRQDFPVDHITSLTGLLQYTRTSDNHQWSIDLRSFFCGPHQFGGTGSGVAHHSGPDIAPPSSGLILKEAVMYTLRVGVGGAFERWQLVHFMNDDATWNEFAFNDILELRVLA